MAGITCLTLLSCIWGAVEQTLSAFLGTAVADSLASIRDRVVERVREWTLFWGNQVEEVPISAADPVGTDEIRGYLHKIGGYLKDDGVGVIGIYGMGGVGKTTLLEMINNKFHEILAPRLLIEVVIWVTVSKDSDILKIQESVGERIGLSLSAEGAGSSSLAEKQSKVIFKALSKRRFLLLLDDVWEKLDLKRVGIPLPTAENKCKIILTTRSKQVCTSMGARKNLVEVKLLNESDSWKLFTDKLGTEEVDLDVNKYARDVAAKCGGLPLALITVGRAMAGARTVWEWQEALEQLKESPHQLPGMKDDVLSPLCFSFDKLRDENTKQCLLYCCLFPEDFKIPVEEIIDYWVGEGLLDDSSHDQSGSIIRARNRGHGVITQLIQACLLQSVDGGVSCVKMHDVVREMCLWLTGGQHDKNNILQLVHAGEGVNSFSRSERWRDAKRVSLIGNKSQLVPHNIPLCPKLQSLLCWSPSSYPSLQGFFQSMPVLRVLDLSFCEVECLPDEIGVLTELRYLNLMLTKIESLPKGLGKLANLSHLNLDSTSELTHIPPEVIQILRGLRVLRLFNSAYQFILPNGPSIEGEGTSSLLSLPSSSPTLITGFEDDANNKCWDKLEELGLNIKTGLFGLQTFLEFDRLCRSTVRLAIQQSSDITAGHLSAAFERLENLLVLKIYGASNKESEITFDRTSKFSSSLEVLHLTRFERITVEITSPSFFGSLRTLTICECGSRDLAWVGHLPRLDHLYIFGCPGLEELLPAAKNNGLEGGGDEAHDYVDDSSLLRLRELILTSLPALKSISSHPMLLPSLERLSVYDCPQLKKLPLVSRSAKNIIGIDGKIEWWESLEWFQDIDGQCVKSRFHNCFSPWP